MRTSTAVAIDARASLVHAFFACAEQHQHRLALVGRGGQGPTYTYGEVAELAAGIGCGLAERGLVDYAGIGLLAENRPEWGIAYLGILAAGATAVPIDASLTAGEIADIIRHFDLKTVICSQRFQDTVKRVAPQVTCFVLEAENPNSLSSLNLRTRPALPSQCNEVAVLIYTAGTTGAPKAVELTHDNLLTNLQQVRKALSFDDHDVFLSVLPLHHTLEATGGFLTPLMSGACVVYSRSLKSKDILEDIAANGVTRVLAVPLLFEKMYHAFQHRLQEMPRRRRMLFRVLLGLSGLGWRLGRRWGVPLFRSVRRRVGMASVRMLVSGGAALPAHIGRFFNLVGFCFLQGYGMTETSPVISVNRPDNNRFSSVGVPVDGLSLLIDRPDGDGVGEILVQGGNITRGYRGNPAKTAELLRDGWLHTGDLGYLRDGHLYIAGRAKSVIVSAAGKNIYPEELEAKLLESNYVMEAVVYGRPKEGRQGEEVHALLVPDMDQVRSWRGGNDKRSEEELARAVLAQVVDEVNSRLARYKHISRWSLQFQELEKSSTRKVKRFVYK